ncbi:MAG: pseudouridine synthase [Erysipelotrichia bacterium]|nr:pseudouridine synthase [Erysipelotrichia bacterium]
MKAERLQKVIAQAGIASRRKAEELISAGKVKVNGQTVSVLGTTVTNKDVITVNDKPIEKEELVYYLVNKPRKYVCTADDEHNRDKIVDLVDCPQRIFPVGRLDYDSTGLIILTNDGDFDNMLTHPKYHLPKTYKVTIKGVLTKKDMQDIRNGIILDDGIKTLPATVRMINYDIEAQRCSFEIIIYEGRNRQIRRMMEALGYEVKKLHRSCFGCVKDDNLAIGSYRRLKPHEIKMLKTMANEGEKK